MSWDDGRSDDPERQIAAFKEAAAGDQPLMSETPSTLVTLFRGVRDGGGWAQEAHVHELNGADEEGIARMMGGSTPTQFLNAMLAYGVKSLGPHDLEKLGVQERMGLLDTLLLGEKEMLFLNVLRVTYGDRRTVGVRCVACQQINDVTFSLSEDVPVKQMDDPFRGLYDYETRQGQRIEYRLVTGADQAEASRKTAITSAEENTLLLSRVITTVDGKPLVDPTKFARDLGAMDRRQLLEDLVGKQPGPYFEEVKLPCATCGAESLFTPGWADLL